MVARVTCGVAGDTETPRPYRLETRSFDSSPAWIISFSEPSPNPRFSCFLLTKFEILLLSLNFQNLPALDAFLIDDVDG